MTHTERQGADFGHFHLTGKDAYDKAIDGPPEFIDPPHLEVVRVVEQGDVVMAELRGTVRRASGGEMRMSNAEVFVMRDGKIAERRAWVIELEENDYRRGAPEHGRPRAGAGPATRPLRGQTHRGRQSSGNAYHSAVSAVRESASAGRRPAPA
ncbi:nuclear transport factor 2 family protein [Nonomuraea sp. NPDC052634]|uniref:nuclear transport factor 2 family protein n=1 Tax=Nonomuraea sp. NPDC052634 TaxID=3155813 RepID=UPI003425D7BC